MSAGFIEVSRDAIEEVGVCIERILDRVERHRRRMRCGRTAGIEGQARGSLGTEKNRWVESSPAREK